MGPQQIIAHYRIGAKLGEGGMGEVWRATDTKLGREVAIKILPARFAADPERMARFEREAKVLASLNHPHIAQIYSVEEHALVMELVEGEALKGPLPLETALDYSRQIADALEAAHEKGIVHRDLKPGNIMVTPAGVVKVLDFGLARVAEEPSSDSTGSATETISPTRAGVILGTAPYMSPEQAEGGQVDKRSDVWSFGVVLYEMLTGRRCFDGKTANHVILHVLEQEPNWEALPASLPSGLRELLERCLRKNPSERPRDVRDLGLQIQDLAEGSTPDKEEQNRLKSVPLLWPTIAAVLSLAVLALGYLYFRPRPAAPVEITRFEIPPPANVLLDNNLALSPDGRKLAFTAQTNGVNQIWIRSMNAAQPRPLDGTQGVAATPFWSFDSRYIVFAAESKLQKIEASGGPLQTLSVLSAGFGGGFWTPDDQIVFGSAINNGRGLVRVSAHGGEPTPVTSLSAQDTGHLYPSLLPDGRHFVYLRTMIAGNAGIYLGSLDAKPNEQASKKLLSNPSPVVYVPAINSGGNGYLLFVRSGTLMAQPFDERRLELAGQAAAVAERITSTFGGGGFSASPSGALVFRAGGPFGGQQLTWFDRQGKNLGTVAEPFVLQAASAPALSRDGKRIAYARNDPSGGTNIWLIDLARDNISAPFTVGTGNNTNPIWSPDGSRIAFFSQRDGVNAIYAKASNLVGGEELLYKEGKPSDPPARGPISWSPDGRFISYGGGASGVWVLPVDGSAERKPIQLVGQEFGQGAARFSPDGRFFTYVSLKSGKYEVYARAFDPSGSAPSTNGGEWIVSKDGGNGAHWRVDGKEIFYLAGRGIIMAVDVKTTPTFVPGTPKPLFKTNAASPYWEVSPDGQRFLVPVRVGANSAAPYTVVLNWQTELRK